MEIARPVQNNRTSDSGSAVSLYQQTLSLIEKLYSLPDFERFLFPRGIDSLASESGAVVIDPIQVLFGCFRLGAPLCVLFNHLQPVKLLQVPHMDVTLTTYTNVSKKCVYHFLVGVKDELGVPEEQLFSLSDLYKDDTNALVKAIKTITIVVDDIERRGLLPPTRPLPFSTNSQTEKPTDNRARVVAELLETERAYITSLQELLAYENELLSSNIVNKDIIYKLFVNLPDLVDFQRRFLISMETTLSLPPMDQRIGALFINNEEGFTVYEPICGNYDVACKLALQEAATLSQNSRIDPMRGLQGYLIKPVQRICKYPLLLNELVKLSSPDTYPYYSELVSGMESVKRVTERVNETKRIEENRCIKQEVTERVEDWKGLRPDDFGNLLLTDRFFLVSHDSEKEYVLFLFERMFLCLKESKKKKKRSGPEETVYTIKGNIHLSSIGRVDDNSTPELQNFELVVHWRDIGEMEAFPLKCRNQEQAKLWKGRLDQLLLHERQRRMSVSEARANEAIAARMGSVSLGNSGSSTPDLPGYPPYRNHNQGQPQGYTADGLEDDSMGSTDEPRRTHSLYHANNNGANGQAHLDFKPSMRKSSPVTVRIPERRPAELAPRTSSINGPSINSTAGRQSLAPPRGQSSLIGAAAGGGGGAGPPSQRSPGESNGSVGEAGQYGYPPFPDTTQQQQQPLLQGQLQQQLQQQLQHRTRSSTDPAGVSSNAQWMGAVPMAIPAASAMSSRMPEGVGSSSSPGSIGAVQPIERRGALAALAGVGAGSTAMSTTSSSGYNGAFFMPSSKNKNAESKKRDDATVSGSSTGNNVVSVETILERSGLAGFSSGGGSGGSNGGGLLINQSSSNSSNSGGSSSNNITTVAAAAGAVMPGMSPEYIPSPPMSTTGSPGAHQRTQRSGSFSGPNNNSSSHHPGFSGGVSRLQTDLRSMPPPLLQPLHQSSSVQQQSGSGPMSPRGIAFPPPPRAAAGSPQPQGLPDQHQQSYYMQQQQQAYYMQQQQQQATGGGFFPSTQPSYYPAAHQQLQDAASRNRRPSLLPDHSAASVTSPSSNSGPPPSIGLPPVPQPGGGSTMIANNIGGHPPTRAMSPAFGAGSSNSLRSQEEAAMHHQHHQPHSPTGGLPLPPSLIPGMRERMTSPAPPGGQQQRPSLTAVTNVVSGTAFPLSSSSTPTSATGSGGASNAMSTTSIAPLIKIKTYYGSDVILIAVPSRGTTYRDLVAKITRKIRLNNVALPEGRDIRLRYRDEEGDYVSMNGDDDVSMAFELARSGADRGLVHITAQ
ncbi:hypothetical protein BASA83_001177 [Batrachochytrium salamandrivorans]|nr:hypothetical protein BASA83_001177 [Batrachochytrium salamandrivorans]